MAKWVDNLHPGSSMVSHSTPKIDGGLHKISSLIAGEDRLDWWRNTCRPWALEANKLRGNATLLLVMWFWWWILATHECIGLSVEFKRFFLALTGWSELHALEQEVKIRHIKRTKRTDIVLLEGEDVPANAWSFILTPSIGTAEQDDAC